MIDLHCVPSGNNLKIGIALEELGLPYRLLAARHVRRLAPEAGVPPHQSQCQAAAIVDHAPTDAGESLAVFESGAILLYLAQKTGSLMPQDWRRRQVAQQWLVWQVAGLGPMLGQANHFCRYAPEGQDYAVERYRREARRLLTVLDRQLRGREFIADEYSMADIACFPWAAGTRSIGIAPDDFPALAQWIVRIEQRPAVAAARAAIFDGERARYMQASARLTPQEWSTLFGDQSLAAARAD
jgi:GST-like protein